MLWWGMAGAFTLVWIFMVVLWLVAVRRDPGEVDDAAAERLQTRWIVGGGLVLPLVAIIAILIPGIPIGHGMLPTADDDVLKIEVTGHQWWWEVHYPDTGLTLEDEVHMPAGVPVHIHLRSADVIHSFWVPRLAGKLDAIPGHENVLKLEADEPGSYRGACAEFCGALHAHMGFVVHVHTVNDFEAWLEGAAEDD